MSSKFVKPRRVEVSFITYNAQYGLYSYVGTNVMFNRGGRIHKLVNIMSAWAGLLNRPIPDIMPLLVSGAVWFIAMVYVFINETKEIIATVRSSRERWWKAIWEDYVAVW